MAQTPNWNEALSHALKNDGFWGGRFRMSAGTWLLLSLVRAQAGFPSAARDFGTGSQTLSQSWSAVIYEPLYSSLRIPSVQGWARIIDIPKAGKPVTSRRSFWHASWLCTAPQLYGKASSLGKPLQRGGVIKDINMKSWAMIKGVDAALIHLPSV